ncbi:class I SAM-dependent methyltransferase [Verrucomicrobia bacterium]|nr:class I SAM-dependent methyltransferase [Verrucomicrobiota bacterium]
MGRVERLGRRGHDLGVDDYQAHNKRAWDERVINRGRHTRKVSPKELVNPLKAVDPEGWLGGSVQGKKVLCLAAGGGLQSALYAKAGATVTVVDLSEEMLKVDREVARLHQLEMFTVGASMDDLSQLPRGHFDLVIQPVSTCYVPDISKVYGEVAKVMCPGGLYISQHKQPVSLQTANEPGSDGYWLKELYHHEHALPPAPEGLMHREAGTMEYIHPWESLVGELCRNGFVLEDLSEPKLADTKAQKGSAQHRYCYAPPYVKLKARLWKVPAGGGSSLIIPG